MKCFIHINDEAVAVCKKCGKAMCGNCSAYTNHSGICPECKREEFLKERGRLYQDLQHNKKLIVVNTLLAVVFAALAIILTVTVSTFLLILLAAALIFGVRIIFALNRRKPIKDRLDYLTEEINKLSVALNRSTAII